MEHWQELEAARRLKIIAPLLDETLDEAAVVARKKDISEDCGLSYRTIGRYYMAFKAKGYEGLMPSPGTARNTSELPGNFDEIVTQAIQLRQELPNRSVPQIIKVLEYEGYAKPGEIKRSTLQRHLQKAGYSSKQMRVAELEGETTADLSVFSDAESIDSWAQSYVEFNVANGLIVGDGSGNLNPLSSISRAETATVVLRLLRNAKLIDVRS